MIRPEKAGDEKLNHLIHEFRAVAERAYAARKKADPAYEETGSIRESYIVPVIGHSITTTVEGEGAVLSFIHSKGVIKDFHMHNEALQKLAHDILEMTQKNSLQFNVTLNKGFIHFFYFLQHPSKPLLPISGEMTDPL